MEAGQIYPVGSGAWCERVVRNARDLRLSDLPMEVFALLVRHVKKVLTRKMWV